MTRLQLRTARFTTMPHPWFPGLIWAINGARLDPDPERPNHVVLTRKEFDALPGYPRPPIEQVGRRWRQPHGQRWFEGEYVEASPGPWPWMKDRVTIRWRQIIVAKDCTREPFQGYR